MLRKIKMGMVSLPALDCGSAGDPGDRKPRENGACDLKGPEAQDGHPKSACHVTQNVCQTGMSQRKPKLRESTPLRTHYCFNDVTIHDAAEHT